MGKNVWKLASPGSLRGEQPTEQQLFPGHAGPGQTALSRLKGVVPAHGLALWLPPREVCARATPPSAMEFPANETLLSWLKANLILPLRLHLSCFTVNKYAEKGCQALVAWCVVHTYVCACMHLGVHACSKCTCMYVLVCIGRAYMCMHIGVCVCMGVCALGVHACVGVCMYVQICALG